MSLDIIVCAKQVPDPEGPPTSYEVNADERKVTATGHTPGHQSLRRERPGGRHPHQGVRGGEDHPALPGEGIIKGGVILKAVASGADASLLVEGEELDQALLDSHATAVLLAAAIKKLGGFDLILCGRQASDTNAGQVGLGIAHFLSIPAVTLAQKVEVENNRVTVERVLPDGYEVVEAHLPALVTVSGEVGDLRYPSLAAIKAAKNLTQTVISLQDLRVDTSSLGKVETVALAAPSRERRCVLIEGDTPEEAGERLALKLREAKIL
jgi:electron transfer flavoprotein beta subunit